MDTDPLLTNSLAFRGWIARVESLARSRLEVPLAELPPLPLELGFARGDTPTEFLFGVVLPLVAWTRGEGGRECPRGA